MITEQTRTCPNCGDGEQNGFEAPNEPLCRVCSFLTSLREADRHMRRAWATFPDNGSTFLTHGERQTFHHLAKQISLFLEEVDA